MVVDLAQYDKKPEVRLLVCRKCAVVDELPDYVGPPEGDDLLMQLVAKHTASCGSAMVGGETPEVAAKQDRFLLRVEAEKWQNDKFKDMLLERLKAQGSGFEDSVLAVRDTWSEDAGACFSAHGRPTSCSDYKDDSKRIGNAFLTDEEKTIQRSSGLFTKLKKSRENKTVYLCDWCPVKSVVQEKAFKQAGLFD